MSVVNATLGIAGVNTRPLHAATVGIAGNWGSGLRPQIEQLTTGPMLGAGTRLGDQAAKACWRHASYLLDYTYVTCPDRVSGHLQYRRGFALLCSPETRALPLYLDSGAYRAAAGTVPRWSSYRRYCEAIELIQLDGAMAWDVLGNQNASFRGYDRLCRDGYAERIIPVWQAGADWNPTFRSAKGILKEPSLTKPCQARPWLHAFDPLKGY